ncbi:unnamed protein product [Rhizophagus irregularis]|uniref:PH domain-like protein n=1 Tax=Rhizophagus irregularis TaxID=588596 RepID=A0A2I1GNV1_9GLOM|nr:PH domain-like protein [Rhizophagus irregularis]CAB4412597.1 unnamed protein product [Rhizophagus irregularis]CAB4413031.1 unnamed protein product [Rhizophagus irregularis]
MSDNTQQTIEYYKSELIKKDEIIKKLSEEVDKDQLKELKIQYQELSDIVYNLKTENEKLKIENEKLLEDLKKKEIKVEDNEEKKEVTDGRNNQQDSLLSQESKQEKVGTAETAEIVAVTPASEATEPVIPEGIKTGNLQKQSQLLKTFDRRYFVLTKDTLYYYKSSNDPSNEKSIDISSDCNVKIVEGTTFDLEAKSRTYTLIADSVEERDSWIKELKECNVNVIPSGKEKSTFNKKNEESTKLEILKSENESDINIQQKPVFPEGVKTGNLHKQSQLLKTFNQRYFVLTKDKLYYYRSSNDPSTQKSIDLSSNCKIKIGESAKFDLETKSRTYKLIADSEEDRDSWIKELKKCNIIVISLEKEKSINNIEESAKLEVPKSENENDIDIDIQQSVDNTVDKATDVVEVSE